MQKLNHFRSAVHDMISSVMVFRNGRITDGARRRFLRGGRSLAVHGGLAAIINSTSSVHMQPPQQLSCRRDRPVRSERPFP